MKAQPYIRESAPWPSAINVNVKAPINNSQEMSPPGGDEWR